MITNIIIGFLIILFAPIIISALLVLILVALIIPLAAWAAILSEVGTPKIKDRANQFLLKIGGDREPY